MNLIKLFNPTTNEWTEISQADLEAKTREILKTRLESLGTKNTAAAQEHAHRVAAQLKKMEARRGSEI